MENQTVTKIYRYLALGDSYTIGEMVSARESFPIKVVTLLKNDSIILSPRIIARTGWTTDELEAGITNADHIDLVLDHYDFVSLSIGVNNQFRGRTADSYKPDFERLVQKAVYYAGNKPERVVVLSIPDWGATPFAEGRDRGQIAKEIDEFNLVNKNICKRYNIYYIDITGWSREAISDPSLITRDGLHPSPKEYSRWAEKLVAYFKSCL